MIKEKRRKRALLKRIVLVVLIVILLLLVAGYVVVNVFTVEEVTVEGNELYDEALIEQTVLNDEYSWNSLYVFLKYTFLDTEALPFIDTMEISLENPHTLHIKVYEKGMMGYLYIPEIAQNAYFDKDGIVIETSTRIIEGVPLIEGIICNQVVLYEKLPIENSQLRQILTLTQSLKGEELLPELNPDAIVYGKKHAPILVYDDLRVYLGSMEFLTQKVARLNTIFPKVESKAGILHFESWSEENTNVVFEMDIPPEEEVENDTEDVTETETENDVQE